MKKQYTLKQRLLTAYLMLKGKDLLVETCENCGNMNIVATYQNPIRVLNDGKHLYTAKYMCKRCGCTAHVSEFWDVDNR